MGEIVRFDRPYWKGFKLPDGKQRWMYTDEKTALRLKEKEYFSKNTVGIVVYFGYETEENKNIPLSVQMYYIGVSRIRPNRHGESGVHWKNAEYVVMDGRVFEQSTFGEAREVVRLTKELKGCLETIKNVRKN
jgi:hypothetical protein